MDISEYLNKLYTSLKEKKLDRFFLLVDNKNFKPLKYSHKNFKEYLKENKEDYINKRIADIIIFVSTQQKFIIEKKPLIQIAITIWNVDTKGTLNSMGSSLKILYYEDDLIKKKITIKDVHKFVKLCADGVLLSDIINGIPYKNLIKKIKNKL